ncbi:MAG: FecR domain-containing protein [Acidobacteriaceae bacterium]|nr:FecR domain-containing protein [Acidobacteriaceae bacterium]
MRLSEVEGNVQIDRNTGQGFENAFVNLPLTQGVKIRTQGRGQAALEFEDGSSVRLAPETSVEISQLVLRDSGDKFSSIKLQEGTAYVNFLGAKDNVLEVTFARESLTLTQAVHLRVAMADVDATIAVFKGQASITGPKGAIEVNKNHTGSFDLLDDHSTVASGVDELAYDSWDKQQAQYQQQYSTKSGSGYAANGYDTADLNYYGNFFNAPGYGTLWQPYFIGAGWDPFMNGAWAFYPGLGYSWASAYPWGWTPYHCGGWTYLSAYGWAWQPGGACMPFSTVPVILRAPAGFVRPRPPLLPGRRIFPSNRGPMPVHTGDKVQIASNSAGVGIPRGSIRNLGQLSTRVEQTGLVTTKVHAGSGGIGWWHGGAASVAHAGTSGGHAGHSIGGGHMSSGGGGHVSMSGGHH